MTLKIRRTGAEDYGSYVKALFAGPPGSGKSVLGSTAPDVLIADCEGGLMSVADKRVPYATIETVTDLHQLAMGLDQSEENQKKFIGFSPKTVVVDTIDEVQRMLVRDRLRDTNKEVMAQQDWGWLKDRMLDVIRSFRNLNMNVIFLTHTKDVHDEDLGKTYTKPGLQGAVCDEIPAYVDIVGLLGVEEFVAIEGKESRRKVRHILTVQPNSRCDWLKDRSRKLPATTELNGEDDFARIHATVFGGAAIPEGSEVSNVPQMENGKPTEKITRSPEKPKNPNKKEEVA